MWTCPKCERKFKIDNQSHYCTDTTIDDLFEGKPDNLLLAFDRLLIAVMEWEPMSVGTSVNTVIFTNAKAWLIVRPMSKELDLKFYYDQALQSPVLKKVSPWGKKFAHHIRVKNEEEVNEEVIRLLKKGYTYAAE